MKSFFLLNPYQAYLIVVDKHAQRLGYLTFTWENRKVWLVNQWFTPFCFEASENEGFDLRLYSYSTLFSLRS